MSEPSEKTRFVAYYRCSTEKQSKSGKNYARGLGLESQRQMVHAHIERVGGELIAEFTEVESGKSARNRPKLQEALALAGRRRNRATLIVAKLDRLARQHSFVCQLLDSDLEFCAVDMPGASRMMIQMVSIFSEYEAKMISDRTKAGLAVTRANGTILGKPENFKLHGTPAPEWFRQQAIAEAKRIEPVIRAVQREGHTQLIDIAAELNRRGYKTERGKQWHPTQIWRILSRLKGVAA